MKILKNLFLCMALVAFLAAPMIAVAAGEGKAAELEKKLVNLIETKYSSQIEEDEGETGAPKENGNAKEEEDIEE